MEESWQDVVGNLYQSIWGRHEEKVEIITKWLTDIVNTPIRPVNINFLVKEYCEELKRYGE